MFFFFFEIQVSSTLTMAKGPVSRVSDHTAFLVGTPPDTNVALRGGSKELDGSTMILQRASDSTRLIYWTLERDISQVGDSFEKYQLVDGGLNMQICNIANAIFKICSFVF